MGPDGSTFELLAGLRPLRKEGRLNIDFGNKRLY
jgi:hypothetical protein